jgi:CheY-like chemotaxis protein
MKVKRKILLVDDERAILKIIGIKLRISGYDVVTATGMRATLVNVGMPLSIGIFFSLIIIGMNASVPAAMYNGLMQHDVPAQIAQRLADAPPVGYLFAAFLGYNPLGSLIPHAVLHALPA